MYCVYIQRWNACKFLCQTIKHLSTKDAIMKCLSMFLGALVGNHGSWFTQRFTCVIKRLAFSYLISEASWEGVFSNPATQIICFHTLIRHHRENVPRTCCRSKIPVAYPTRTVTHTDTHTHKIAMVDKNCYKPTNHIAKPCIDSGPSSLERYCSLCMPVSSYTPFKNPSQTLNSSNSCSWISRFNDPKERPAKKTCR